MCIRDRVGSYSSDVAYGQSRVLVAWQRIIFPDGKTMDIGAMPGADGIGQAGFKDQVNNHYLRIFGSALLMSAVIAGATYSQRDAGGGGVFGRQNAGSILSQSLGQQLGQATTRLMMKNLNIAPTLEIRPGFRFNAVSYTHLEWISTIIELNNSTITPAQRNEISNAITSMHRSNAKTLSEFVVTIQDDSIRDVLAQYTIDGMMGHLLDAENDGLTLSSFTTFEIEELMNLGQKYALPTLLYLFRRIERDLHGQPAAIILDEAWLMLGHAAFREKIREWLKVMRKANCFVLMATQSLSDAANSGILDVIVESTATKIFLPNVHARDQDTAALYRRMGLNTRQIGIIASAVDVYKRQQMRAGDSYVLALNADQAIRESPQSFYGR